MNTKFSTVPTGEFSITFGISRFRFGFVPVDWGLSMVLGTPNYVAPPAAQRY
eukprot:SAG31_NODE_516_length_14707_cov_3.026629_1_plen_51_part_10